MTIGGIDFALLRFCLEHNDSPNLQDRPLVQRDPKDYEWLRKVMESIPTPAKQMQKCLEVLRDEEELDCKLAALEELQDLVEDIDNANDLAKMGLGEVAQAAVFKFGSENLGELDHKIREEACFVLSTLAQNNPFCQKQLKEQGILPIILQLLKNETDFGVVNKALGVVSAMARDFPEGVEFFDNNAEDLSKIFLNILKGDHTSNKVKCSAVIRHVSTSSPTFKEVALKLDVDKVLRETVENSDDESLKELGNMALAALAA